MRILEKKINKNLHKIIFFLPIISVLLLFLFNISTANASGLIPCGGTGEPECDLNQFIILIQNIIDFVIKIAIPAAAILFAYAGFLYLTASGKKGQIEDAHKIFTSVLWGFIIILSAWLIVNTIVNVLLDKTNFETYLDQG
jgi:hypothetical protein